MNARIALLLAAALTAGCKVEHTVGAETPCVPLSCQQQGIACGPAVDSCGQPLDCGRCPFPEGPEGFSWEMPSPQGNPLTAIWAISSNDVWAGGKAGTLMHFDGTAWRLVPIGTVLDVDALWASGPNDVWATVGSWSGNAGLSEVLHFNGASWSRVLNSRETRFHALRGSSADNVWLAGEKGALYQFDGGKWVGHTEANSGTLLAVAPLSATDVWALENTGDRNSAALHYDGTSWQRTPLSTDAALDRIWANAGDDVWMVGSASFRNSIWHFNGSAFEELQVPQLAGQYNLSFTSLLGFGRGDLLVVAEGKLVHFQNGQWQEIPLAGQNSWPSLVGGVSASDLWITDGQPGQLWHFDGSGWSTPFKGNPGGWMVSGYQDDLWASGRVLLHRTAEGWVEVGLPEGVSVAGTLWVSGPEELWMTGEAGVLWHLQAGKWTRVELSLPIQVRSLRGEGRMRAYLAGHTGTGLNSSLGIFSFDGSSWDAIDASALEGQGIFPLSAWGSGPNDVWLSATQWTQVTANSFRVAGAVFHYDGAGWSRRPESFQLGMMSAVGSMWGSAPNDLWLAGKEDVYHWDGASWSVSTTTAQRMQLMTLWGFNERDVWGAGSCGNSLNCLVHFDGAKWNAVDVPYSGDLTSLWGDVPGRLWIGGNNGAILRYRYQP